MIEPGWWMIVHAPAPDANSIAELIAISHQIVLGQDVIADDAPAAAFARHHAEPIQSPGGAARMVTRVFDVIPNSQSDAQQLKTDALVVLDGVQLSTPFDPPIPEFP